MPRRRGVRHRDTGRADRRSVRPQRGDSLSAYLTWQFRPARRDSGRDGVSNLRRPRRLGYLAAAKAAAALIETAWRRRPTGIVLNDGAASLPPSDDMANR